MVTGRAYDNMGTVGPTVVVDAQTAGKARGSMTYTDAPLIESTIKRKSAGESVVVRTYLTADDPGAAVSDDVGDGVVYADVVAVPAGPSIPVWAWAAGAAAIAGALFLFMRRR